MSNKIRLLDEGGGSLLELVIAMPLAALLLGAVGVLFTFGAFSFAGILGDFELQEEIRFVAERVSHDLKYATDAKIENGTLSIYCRISDEDPRWITYELTKETRPRVMRLQPPAVRQPLTGESMIGDAEITGFYFDFYDDAKRTMVFEISGRNNATGYEFSLRSAVTMAEHGS